MIDETPTPALADCDDPVSRLLLARRRLDELITKRRGKKDA